MKMFANLGAFLGELFDDYSAHYGDVENCFYYRYLKKRKSEQAAAIVNSKDSEELLADYAARTKPNKFVLLRAAYLSFKNGRITADAYKKHFARVSDGKKKTAELMAADITTADDAKEFNDALEKQLLKNLVSDFFDNAGFKKGADNVEQYFDKNKKIASNTRIRSKYSKHSKSLDKYTDDIDMLYCYLQYKNAELSDAPAAYSAGLSETFKNDCAELFRSLCKSSESDVFMPLYFDPVSGAGVFIIGKERFYKSLKEELTENCAACIVHFSHVSVDIEPSVNETLMDLCMYVDICENVSAAFEEFEDGVASEAYLTDLSDENVIGKDIFNDKRFSVQFGKKMSLRETMIAEQSIKEKQHFEEQKHRNAIQIPVSRTFDEEINERQRIKDMMKKLNG